MKKAMLVLFVLVALVNSAEAIEFMNRKEFVKSFQITHGEIFLSSVRNQFPKVHTHIVFPYRGESLGVVVIVSFGKEQSAIFLHLVFVYVLLSPVELGLIILAVTILSISAYTMLKDGKKESKVNE